MSEGHKAVIAAGRIEAAAVRNYLEAPESPRPKRGRRVGLEALADEPGLPAVEAGLIEHAASYGARKDIAYGTWRKSGVSAALLGRSDITRGS